MHHLQELHVLAGIYCIIIRSCNYCQVYIAPFTGALAGIYCIIYRNCCKLWQVYIASSTGAACTGRYILYHHQELQLLPGIYCTIYRSTGRYILHHLLELLQALAGIYCIIYRKCCKHWQVYSASFKGATASTGRYILYHLQKLLQALAGIYCIIYRNCCKDWQVYIVPFTKAASFGYIYIASFIGTAASTGRYILYHLQELQALTGIYCIIFRNCCKHWQVYIVSFTGAAACKHWQVYIASFTGTAATTGRYT